MSLSVVKPPSRLPTRKPPVAGPREALKELLDQRARAAARIADLEKANGRLSQIFEALILAKAALDRFEADAAAAMLAWSKNSLKSEAPVVNSDEKFKLMSALADSQNQAQAAAATRTEITASINAEALAAKALETPITHAIAGIIIEEASGSLLDEAREAVVAALAAQDLVKAAFDQIITIAHAGDLEVNRPILMMAEQFSDTIRRATAPPMSDGSAARTAWTRFMTDLRNDPEVEFKI